MKKETKPIVMRRWSVKTARGRLLPCWYEHRGGAVYESERYQGSNVVPVEVTIKEYIPQRGDAAGE